MAKDFDNNMRGSLWPAKERRSEKSPHLTGTIEINGVKYALSAWKRPDDAPKNRPYYSLRVQPYEDRSSTQEPRRDHEQRTEQSRSRESPPPARAEVAFDDGFDSECPF